MHLLTVPSLLLAATSLSHAQPAAPAANAANHWCGEWAGSPEPAEVPAAQLFPPRDYTRRFFVEPQLQNTPFAPIMATEEKVQVPKIWGNNGFRVALLSYRDQVRTYSSSKSRWSDFGEALDLVMQQCVRKGTGGAFLVPPSPGLTQSTLAVYAYAVGSYFDFQMNYYMSTPAGINPASLRQSFAASNGSLQVPAVDVL